MRMVRKLPAVLGLPPSLACPLVAGRAPRSKERPEPVKVAVPGMDAAAEFGEVFRGIARVSIPVTPQSLDDAGGTSSRRQAGVLVFSTSTS